MISAIVINMNCYFRYLEQLEKNPEYFFFIKLKYSVLQNGGRRGRDRMVWRGVQHCVIKFVSNLRQVSGFLRVLRFLPSIKLTATI